MKKLINAQNLIEDLKNNDIDSYNEIKENTIEVAKKWGGKRINAGRKAKNENNVLSFQMKVSEKERKFLLHARECNINYDDLMEC